MLKQALSLCASLVSEDLRFEASFFEAVRVMLSRLMNQGHGKKLSLKEVNEIFLERNAISKAQYDKSLGDLIEKMGMERVLRETGEALVLPCRKPLI